MTELVLVYLGQDICINTPWRETNVHVHPCGKQQTTTTGTATVINGNDDNHDANHDDADDDNDDTANVHDNTDNGSSND